MWRIVAGLIAQGISYGLLTVMFTTRDVGMSILLAVLVLVIALTGFSVLLEGIKSFFLDDILNELKKLNAPRSSAADPATPSSPPEV